MPDIALCQGTGCKIRDVCYRHLVQPSTTQQWAEFWLDDSFDPATGCKFFRDYRLPGNWHGAKL